jgi:hypothetical protein
MLTGTPLSRLAPAESPQGIGGTFYADTRPARKSPSHAAPLGVVPNLPFWVAFFLPDEQGKRGGPTRLASLLPMPTRRPRRVQGGRPPTASECQGGGVDQPLKEASVGQAGAAIAIDGEARNPRITLLLHSHRRSLQARGRLSTGIWPPIGARAVLRARQPDSQLHDFQGNRTHCP